MRELTDPTCTAAPGQTVMQRPLRVTVFCGSSPGQDPAFGRAARTVGALLAAAGAELVYGGARIGLMGALADAALAAGGEVTGVIPRSLNRPDIVHPALTRLEVVADMATRKAVMRDLADAFLILPGGLGALEELAEMWSGAQLALNHTPIAVANIGGFFDPLLHFLASAQQAGFLSATDRDLITVDTDIARLTTTVLNQLTTAEMTSW